jgi:hypothetical protein
VGDYSELERLVGLRESGALTEAEYTALKRQIIDGTRRRTVWPFVLATVAVLAVAAVVILAVLTRYWDDAPSESLTTPAATSVERREVSAPTSTYPAKAVVPDSGPSLKELETFRAEVHDIVMNRIGIFFLSAASDVDEREGPVWRTQNLLDEQMVQCAGKRFHERQGLDIVRLIDRMIDDLIPTETGVSSLAARRVSTKIINRLETEHDVDVRGPLENYPLLFYVVLTCGGVEEARAKSLAGL